ncbi:spermidine/putrescine ABC transporter substrate-binding protein [Agromyces endophyticus]|uniref:spermidine/putrescine ABC transporter substrate-binding protein n=1 Tax=Agromyces sp. H17E-10 TaxID=2932244 RepID=UPI001FD5C78A|nr:spermidine/putrescine ABC transporter substrate-binding protein [Agromyces sp. H17E-10]UOQ88247.1 spermidine/putrescine ABC transporter substrate-binding protein [Agromyces sp. H17E-10]
MEGSVEARVSHEVDRWLQWLPRWRPGSHRARTRLCQRCFGSPIIAAAGLDVDVPHPVQHAFSMRMKGIIDDAVDDYTARNLPMLHREIRLAEERKARRPYRAGEGLDPEYLGLELDPEPVPDQPFLFTLGGLEADTAAEANEPAPRPFTPEEKEALREEVRLADDFAKQLGRRICVELAQHRYRIGNAIERLVEPQVADMLADLDRELDAPGWAGGAPG